MNIKEHRKDFNRRWNIESSDSSKEVFIKFKQRILNIFETAKFRYGDIEESYYLESIDNLVTEESALKFCQYYSISEKWETRGLTGFVDSLSGNNTRAIKITIIDKLKNETIEKEFYRLIEVILNILDFQDGWKRSDQIKQILIKRVIEAVEISDNVAITKSKNSIILYPKGEEKLDEELVNQTLSFLNKQSNKHFEEALNLYQNKKPIKSSESLRRSLEEFLRYKLDNKTGLRENINVLQKRLKNNSNSKVRNIIFQTFNYLDKYFNEHSKHNDGTITEPENEFLIYQIGLLLRYINKTTLKK